MENTLIGYVQDRSNLEMTAADQMQLLIEHGVNKKRIYELHEGLEEAINSCREGLTLVVWSGAVLGTQTAYDETIDILEENGANLRLLHKPLDVDCKAGAGVLQGHKDIRAANGRMGERVGRRKVITTDRATLIKKYVREGHTQAEAAEYFTTDELNVSTRAVSWIMNGTYFKNQKGKGRSSKNDRK